MHADNSRGSFEDIVRASSPEVAALAYRLRELIARVYPDVTEVPRPAEHHAQYGIGTSKGSGIFGIICPMKDYVRLGFHYGSQLADPNKLLEGTGKRLRHIKIYSRSEADRPEVRRLLQAAIRERQKARVGR
jgi:hypothetical protein